MTRLNWFRPELIDADNRKREYKRLAALYNYEGPQTENTWDIGPKTKIIIDKIEKSDLSEGEIFLLKKFFDLISKYRKYNLTSLSPLVKRNDQGVLKQESKKIYLNLVDICEFLIILEAVSRLEGREKGIGWILNFLKPRRRRNTENFFESLHYWNLINELLEKASDNLSSKSIEEILDPTKYIKKNNLRNSFI